MKEEKKFCGLCGEKIVHTKGQPKNAYKHELQSGAHVSCQRVYQGILEKHHISQNEYIGAVINGLFELFPEMDETKAMKEYNDHRKKAEEEIETIFPHLKKKEEKKVGEKKQDDTKSSEIPLQTQL